MEKHIHLIIPTVLILLAGFLAYNMDSLELRPVTSGAVQPITSFSIKDIPADEPPARPSMPITGLAVVDEASCNPEDILFRLTDASNAHIGVYDAPANTHPYVACLQGLAGDRECIGPRGNYDNLVIAMDVEEFGHASTSWSRSHQISVCSGSRVSCHFEQTTECSGVHIGPQYFCLASISDNTNAHVGECGVYPIQLCCKTPEPPKEDSDNDGVPNDGAIDYDPCDTGESSDCDDNCPNRPNGPNGGSCMNEVTRTCMSDADCNPSDVCSLDQEDSDDDGAGDVCDDAPNDPCTIGNGDGVLDPSEIDDACAGFIDCGSLVAQWSTTSEVEGERVSVDVTGSSDCNGLTFLFNVHEDSDASIITIDPQPSTFSGGRASSTWTAEYHSDADDNVYVFQALAIVNGSSLQVSSTNSLTVTANSGALCGNGLIEGSNDEECDDGNTQDLDGCSSNCTLEGAFGNECSNECPVLSLAVCSGSEEIRYCGQFDGDPCYDLSDARACPGATVCSAATGDAECIPPTCEDQYQCSISSCVDGFKTRTCTNTGSNPCEFYHPQGDIPCLRLEEPTNIPVFSWINVLVTVSILGLVYVARRKFI